MLISKNRKARHCKCSALRATGLLMSLIMLSACGHGKAIKATEQLQQASVAASQVVSALKDRDEQLVETVLTINKMRHEKVLSIEEKYGMELDAHGNALKARIEILASEGVADIYSDAFRQLDNENLNTQFEVSFKPLVVLINQYAEEARLKTRESENDTANVSLARDAALLRSRYNAALSEFYYIELNARQLLREKVLASARSASTSVRDVAVKQKQAIDIAFNAGKEQIHKEVTALELEELNLEPAKGYAALDAYVTGVNITANQVEAYLDQPSTLVSRFGNSMVDGLTKKVKDLGESGIAEVVRVAERLKVPVTVTADVRDATIEIMNEAVTNTADGVKSAFGNFVKDARDGIEASIENAGSQAEKAATSIQQ